MLRSSEESTYNSLQPDVNNVIIKYLLGLHIAEDKSVIKHNLCV